MKTVSGRVVSTKPISLPKAAVILSKFAASDNGATPAFAAYLKRASASFDELAQLHKKHRTSGGRDKIKKQPSESAGSFISEGTVHSVIGVKRKELRGANKGEGETVRVDAGSNVDDERRHKNDKSGEDEGRCNAGGSVVDGNLAGSDMEKKSKKKGRTNETEAVTTGDQHLDNHEVVNAKDLKNAGRFVGSEEKKKKKREKHEREKADEIESLDVNREMRTKKKNDKHEKVITLDAVDVKNEIESHDVSRERTKKENDNHEKDKSVNAVDVKNEMESFDVSKERRTKNKNDKHKKEEKDDLVDIKKEMQSRSSSEDGKRGAIQVVENDDDDVQKKRKKHKTKNEIKEERSGEERVESKGHHVDKGHEKKHKKQRHHDEEEKVIAGKLNVEGADDKESRKRKHESVGNGEFDGSQEQHKSKKKKR